VDSSQVIAALGGAMPQAVQGAQTPALVPAQRVELRGVIAEGRRGVALLSIDGQPAKPYAVGSRLDAQRMLKAVGPRHAELAEHASGATLERLEMPQPASAPLPAGVELIQVPRP
jgi:general secretion pathway protein C